MNPEMILGWAYLIVRIALFGGILYVAVREIRRLSKQQDDPEEGEE